MTIQNPAPATKDGFGALRVALFETNGQGPLRNIKFFVGGDVTANSLAISAESFIENRINGVASTSDTFNETDVCDLTAADIISSC